MVNGISDATGAVLGADLGCGNYKKAKIETNYFLGLAGILALGIIVLIVIFARPIVGMFGITGKSSILLSVNIVRVLAVRIAFRFFNVIIFAALRAGGDSKFLMFIDSGIMWGVGIMITFFAASVLRLNNILIVILLGQLEQLVRLIIGFKRYRSNAWLNTLTF
ncbi:MAG: MATE family efflux transporter, partial [Bacillota bacterium]|nr:MATE family efflux transporter [Bacillota bacterium]